ncbi:MAG: nitroreductase family protein [Firmicutes bacterium]|nr:nitroreductase family protein [Bacillota bacterium]
MDSTVTSTIDLIRRRVSLRNYAPRPITPEHLDLILESAMRAPTAGNMMLYSIIVVEDPAKKQALSVTCDHQPFIAKAPLVLVFLADMQRWYDYYQLSGVKEFRREQGEDFTSPDEGSFLLACCDALIAAQNAVIAAESLGIGSCYIGDIMENIETHRELLQLPDWTFPVAMACFGYYPGERPQPRPRFDRRFIVFTDAYRRLSEGEFAEMFAGSEAKFNPGNRFGARNIGQETYARKTGAEFAREMARSVRKALEAWNGKKL